MGLKDIEKTIDRHVQEQREELIEYYKSLVSENVSRDSPLDKNRMLLVLDVSRYLNASERHEFQEKVIENKTIQIRTFILDNFKDNFQSEQTHFSKISKWMIAAIQEIRNTFYDNQNVPIDKDLTTSFHRRFCNEIKALFCSEEKFNSAGNQLLIDLHEYFAVFQELDSEKQSLVGKIRRNFNPSKALPQDKIEEICKNARV